MSPSPIDDDMGRREPLEHALLGGPPQRDARRPAGVVPRIVAAHAMREPRGQEREREAGRHAVAPLEQAVLLVERAEQLGPAG